MNSVSLAIEPGVTRVTSVDSGGRQEFELPVGIETIVSLFRRDPPQPVEVEHAIEVIEDVVMPLTRRLPAAARLHAGNAATLEIARLAVGGEANAESTLAAVEQLFGDLARATDLGYWLPASGLDRSRAAALILLREFMHHGAFSTIGWVAPAPTAGW